MLLLAPSGNLSHFDCVVRINHVTIELSGEEFSISYLNSHIVSFFVLFI